MDICVVGLDDNLVQWVATNISEVLRQHVIRLDIEAMSRLYAQGCTTPKPRRGNWIVTGGPKKIQDYRIMAWAGYDPDMVIYVSTTMKTEESRYLESICCWYEGRVSAFTCDSPKNILAHVNRLIRDESKTQ